jgi:hypothetical protein
VPKRPVRVLVAVAHGQIAVTPSTTRAEALRHVWLVRVGRISAGNRGRKNKRRSTTQYRSALASELEFHFNSPKNIEISQPIPSDIKTCDVSRRSQLRLFLSWRRPAGQEPIGATYLWEHDRLVLYSAGSPVGQQPNELSNKPNTQSSTQRAAFYARSRRDF